MPSTERRPILTVVNGSLPEPPYPEGILARGWSFDLNVNRIEQSDTWTLCPIDLRPWLLMLWMKSWSNAPCGTYPVNEEIIAARIGMPYSMFKVHRDVLLRGWTKCSDGRLYHHTVTELVLKMISMRTSDRVRQAKHKAGIEEKQEPDKKITRESDGITTTHALLPSPSPLPKKKNPSPIASAEFENFWTSYGKKVGRQAALREWSKLDPQGDLLVKVLQAAAAQTKLVEAKYRKDPERWLRDRRWEDQRPPPEQPALMPLGPAPPRNWAKSSGV